jgi:heme-degrading monooxygenase HmoA
MVVGRRSATRGRLPGVFVRIWEYDAPEESVDRFIAAYGPFGDWARLFARGDGFVRTELFRSTQTATRFITVDVWSSEAAWQAFLHNWGARYAELDTALQSLAAGGTLLAEGGADPTT